MAWTSLLECSDGSYYVGSTRDLERRVSEHQLGRGATYTRSRRPVRLVWSEHNDSVTQAFRLEKQIQSWSRAKRRALIEKRYVDLPELARGRSGRPEEEAGT